MFIKPLYIFFAIILFILANYSLYGQPPVRVACIGNSITEGFDLPDAATMSYPTQLGNLLGSGYSVVNFGVSSRTLLKNGDYPYWNESKYTDALNYDPQVVIIELGSNDSKKINWDVHCNEFFSDYKDLVNSFRENGKNPQIIVCKTPPAFFDNFDIRDLILRNKINPLIDSVSRTLGTSELDLYNLMMPYGYLFNDGIHPNEEGAGIMAQMAYNVIKNCPSFTSSILVNGGLVSQSYNVTANTGDMICLIPQDIGGIWNWAGPNSFSSDSREISLDNIQSNQGGLYNVIYTNQDGCKISQKYVISLNGCTPGNITPFTSVNNEDWKSDTCVNLKPGDKVLIGSHPVDGIWTWTGPMGFNLDIRQISLTDILTSQAGLYVTTYTNDAGCQTKKTYQVNVIGNDICYPIVTPSIDINNTTIQLTDTIILTAGDTIKLCPQPNTCKWNWSGPNGFTDTTRNCTIKNIDINQSGIYCATHTNLVGCKVSTEVTLNVKAANPETLVNESPLNKETILFPNPATYFITLTNINPSTEISIIDINGIVLLRKLSSKEFGKINIDITSLKGGNYFVRLNNNKKGQYKFIKLFN